MYVFTQFFLQQKTLYMISAVEYTDCFSAEG